MFAVNTAVIDEVKRVLFYTTKESYQLVENGHPMTPLMILNQNKTYLVLLYFTQYLFTIHDKITN